MMYVQAMVNCDLPGFRALTVGGSTSNISGFRPFKSWLAQLSTIAPSGVSFQYDEATDRVSAVYSGGGSVSFTLESESMKQYLGAGALVNTITETTAFPNKPLGIVPCSSVHIADPVTNNKPTLEHFRHGRTQASSWGSGTHFNVHLIFDHGDGDRLQAGPCSVGKVRIGEYTAASVYSSANLSGYLDAVLVGQTGLGVQNEENPQHLETSFRVLVPKDAHSETETVAENFFGHLDRGHSLTYYVEVEGLNFRFSEHIPPNISSDSYTDKAILVVDGSQKVRFKLDRSKGVAGASGLKFGLMDYDNSLSIFKKPTNSTGITSAVTPTATTINVADASSFGASGSFFLGNELISYTGKTGTSFTGCSRPFGPGYAYDPETVSDYRTITDQKVCWNGSEVKLNALLIDPLGYAVDTTWRGGDYYREMYKGQVEGLPGYSNGLWVVHTKDLIRRLSTKVGQAAVGKTKMSQNIVPAFGSAEALNQAAGLLCFTGAAAACQVYFRYESGGSTVEYLAALDLNTPNTDRIRTYYQEIHSLCFKVMDHVYTGSTKIIENVILTPMAPEFSVSESGDVVAGINARMPAGGAAVSKLDILAVLPTDKSPQWLKNGMIFWENSKDGWISTADDELVVARSTGMRGTTSDILAISQPPQTGAFVGTFPASGYLAVDGNQDRRELVKYTAKDTTSVPGITIFTGLTRSVMGPTVNFFSDGKKVTAAERQINADGSANSFGAWMCKVLESSGVSTERGAFDTLQKGFGYALKASTHVLDDAATATRPDQAFTGALTEPCDLVISGGKSFQDFFGGFLAARKYCAAWVRDGAALKIGVAATTPAGNFIDYTLTDSDLLTGQACTVQKVSDGPNEVIVKQSASPVTSDEGELIYRILEDMLARGTSSMAFSIYGMNTDQFYTWGFLLSASLVQNSRNLTAYKMKVRPSKDWLAGQMLYINTSYPGIWDWSRNAPGLQGRGRITEVVRDLSKGECEITVLVGSFAVAGPLCPCATVTGYTTSGGNGVLTFNLVDIFKAGEPIRLYNPGYTTAEERTILSIDTSAKTVTVSGVFGFTPTNNFTQGTYPLDTNAGISVSQDSFVHVNDGSVYE